MFLRRRKNPIQIIKNLDAFPKTDSECLHHSTSGGTFSVISFVLMFLFITWETIYYMETSFHFRFEPDIRHNERLKIYMDITIAMSCRNLHINCADEDDNDIDFENLMKKEETWFELDETQSMYFRAIERSNSYMRESYHSINKILLRQANIYSSVKVPDRTHFPKRPKDACRFHGQLYMNKGKGIISITSMQAMEVMPGLKLILSNIESSDYNYSHRIERFSFADSAPGIIQALEGGEKHTDKAKMAFSYFMGIVPIKLNTYEFSGQTYQYSVYENQHEISHEKGMHGFSGLFFHYDMSALNVVVDERHTPFQDFLTRLIGIVGGIFTCSGLIHRIIDFILVKLRCRRRPLVSDETPVVSDPTVMSPVLQSPNPLLSKSNLTDQVIDGPVTVPINVKPPDMDISPGLSVFPEGEPNNV